MTDTTEVTWTFEEADDALVITAERNGMQTIRRLPFDPNTATVTMTVDDLCARLRRMAEYTACECDEN